MTESQERYKKKCLQLIEEKLGWGAAVDWSNADFQQLSKLIYEDTKVMLSPSTLKRVWGRVVHQGNPATSTLDALVRFIGHRNWRAFIVAEENKTQKTETLTMPRQAVRNRAEWKFPVFWLVLVFVAVVVIIGFFYNTQEKGTSGQQLLPADFSFASKALSKGIPNSVIFSYDARHAPKDSTVFIQQSWDATRRKEVPRAGHQFTAIYYEPGFYTAKLSIGQQVVKEQPLLIPSDGWLATITRSPIPIYLQEKAYTQHDRLEIPLDTIEKHTSGLTQQVPVTKYFNVGNFKSLNVEDFTFQAEVKNNYREGTNACQFSQILLITTAAPIVIPLSIKGCVSELNLMSVDQLVSGKSTDLSAFGVDFSNWVKVSCKGDENNIRYYINDHLAYETPLVSKGVKIVGMAFLFMGRGSVKHILLKSAAERIYQEF